MASLQDLLADEGFRTRRNSSKSVKSLGLASQGIDSVVLPIRLCRERKSPVGKLAKSRPRRSSSVLSSERASFTSVQSSYESSTLSVGKGGEPAVDDGAIKVVVAMLGGYIGRYFKEESFRNTIREKCESCVASKEGGGSGDEMLENLETGIESVEDLVRNLGTTSREAAMDSLKDCIRLLNAVVSSNSDISRRKSTARGVPISYPSACARLYLSIAHKIEGRNSSSARHLLQVFCDSPFLARTLLLRDIWEHLFLPHLLHNRIWYDNEVESICRLENFTDDIKLKSLSKLYNERMDTGTARLAAYYLQQLKVGADAPPVPGVSSRLKHIQGEQSRRKSLEHRRASVDSVRNHGLQRRKSMDSCMLNSTVDKKLEFRRELTEFYRDGQVNLWPMSRQCGYFPVLNCQGMPRACLTRGTQAVGNGQIESSTGDDYVLDDVRRAISTICCSDALGECEAALRTVTRAWLGSHRNRAIGSLVSEPSFIEGALEVLFASNDDEVLELALSFLAEIVVSNESNGRTILLFDPQLDVFIRLLRRTSVFLKAAALLYLLKPQAKLMTSTEWVPLILRVLEFGDQTQILFKFRCIPRIAAFYFLNELLLGFDEDKNSENARELVSLGGLGTLMKRFESGADFNERKDIATIVQCCIKADGICRNYVSENISPASLLELLVLELHKSSTSALILLTELLCLDRRSKIDELLNEMRTGWVGLRTIHALLIYLQKSSLDERPVVAAVLLLFDLSDDSSECSLYREEAVDAITAALGCESCSKKIQEQSARCLQMLGGGFSVNGEATIEQWLLERSGFRDSPDSIVHGRDIINATDNLFNKEEAKAQRWQRKAALVLLNCGRGKFLRVLSCSMENGIPVLSRACLVTLSWLSSFLHMADEKSLQMEACSIFFPQLLKSLKFDRDLEERVLATVALLNLVKNTGCFSTLYPLDEDATKLLRNLSLVTWAAEELLSMENTASRNQYQ